MVKKSKKLHKNYRALISCTDVKGNAQFVQKVTFESLINFKQDHYGSWKCYKSCYFLKLSVPKLLKHAIIFFVVVLFNLFTR